MGKRQATENEDGDPPAYAAEDRTVYWTLSFYIPYSRMDQAEPDAQGSAVPEIRPLPPPFQAQATLNRLDAMPGEETLRTREAVDPLFNDIADRTRQGQVFDRLLVDGRREPVIFHLPEQIGWKTEGRRFRVPIPASDRERPAEMRRFWYLHSNGAMSWHVAFALRYGQQLERELAEGRVSSLYFLSLLQKLAWPKECDATNIAHLTTDELLGVQLARPGHARAPFWDKLQNWFKTDRATVAMVHPGAAKLPVDDLLPQVPCIEVPGLNIRDARSLFFVQDAQFFNLIQPRTRSGVLVPRRRRILDDAFKNYPKLVRAIAPENQIIVLGEDFWRDRLAENELPSGQRREKGGEDTDEVPLPGAAERVLYLFLAGFNQNIIDWANQEASEVLDSLDPIYPFSDEQTEEGFFIRYANPRSLITYVPQSRTLEVGNDHILTCPYAFLIHVLAMNNEHLTREKEKRAFEVIDWVSGKLAQDSATPADDRANSPAAGGPATRGELAEVERQINRLRIDSFEHFDRHRYGNPFRYDTERDVFEALEKLRGTSRLEHANKEALVALEGQVKDLERRRADDEREQESRAEAIAKDRDRSLAALFGLIGLSGVGQLLFALRDYLARHDLRKLGRWGDVLMAAEALILAVIFVLIGWCVLRFLLFPALRLIRRARLFR